MRFMAPIDRQSYTARRLVLNLADVFRYFLQGDRTMISFSEELRIVQAYLEIETVRLGDRIETELLVSDSVRETSIPILSIQPLVENAVKHGIAPKQGSGRVSVRAEREKAGLRITVEDTGVGFERSRDAEHRSTSLGLDNVRRRLAICYGPTAELEIRSSADRTIVTSLIPDRLSVDELPAEIAALT